MAASYATADESVQNSSPPPIGTHLLFGLDAGIGLLSTAVTGEAGKSGYSLAPKLLASYYFRRSVIEVGSGFFLNKVVGTRTDGTEITIEHTSVFIEVGARYLLEKRRFEIGALGLIDFGQDLSFRPTVLPLRAEDPRSMILLLGVQGLYRFSLGETWLGRAGLRVLTDINVNDRQFYAIQGVIHIGFPLSKTDESQPIARPEPPKPTPPKVEPTAAVERKRVALPRINFDTNSAVIEPQSRQFLLELGAFLKTRDSAWGDVVVEGHSDSRGEEDKNLVLSQQRAESVRRTLTSTGTNPDKIKAVGYGENRPLVKEENLRAWFINRRVDLQFSKNSDVGIIAGEVERLQKKLKLQ